MSSEPADSPRNEGRRRLVLTLPALGFAGFAGVAGYAFWKGLEPSKIPSAMIGRPAPAAAMPPLEGLSRDGVPVPGLAAGDLKAGKVAIVNVFASWCAPCHAEHPVLVELSKTGKARMVGINYKDDTENARRFLGKMGNPYDIVAVDPTGRAAIEWGVYGVPETFIVGPDGTILKKHVGPISVDDIAGEFLPVLEKAAKA